MTKIKLLLLAVFISGCTSRAMPRLWDAASIASYPNPVVIFKNKPNGKVLAGVYTADVRKIIRITEQVENAAGTIRVKLLIEDSGEPNGFSFFMHGQPIIAVNIGMINLLGQDSDAIAALMGHELAHLYLEHGNLRRNREENRVMTSVALSFALGMAGIPAPVDLTDVATTAVSNTFTREEERDADRFGVGYMAQAGFDPWGAVRLQEKLKSVAKGSLLPFLSSHPAGDERIKNMKHLAMEMEHKQAEAAPSSGKGEN